MYRAGIVILFAFIAFAMNPKAASAGTSDGSANSAAGSGSHTQAAAGPAKSRARSKPPASKAVASKRTEQSAETLPTIVVTATRIRQPLSEIGTTVTVVDQHQMQSQKIEQSGDVLREVPGVVVTQSGSPGTVTDVSIRGSTPAQTLILLDGVEVNSGATGSFDLSNITTGNLNRIEVVRGAGGSLYGSQAIGGVVNMIMDRGHGPPKVSYLSEGGNRATQDQVLTINGAYEALGYAGALSYFSTTGYHTRNNSSDNLSGALRLDYQASNDTAMRGFARYFRSNVSLSDAANFTTPVDPNAHQREEFMLFKGEVDHRFGSRLKTSVQSYFVRDDLRVNELPFPQDPAREIDRIPDEIRGTTWEAEYAWAASVRTLIGFDFKDRWVRSVDEFTDFGVASNTAFHARRQEYAGYLEQEASLFHGLVNATGGFRVDGNSNFGTEESSSWAVAIPLARYGLTFRGSYSEGFRAPSFNELFFPFFGNPNLSPEISSEYDGGVTKTFGERTSFTATYFSRRVHNLIVAVPEPPPVFSRAGNAERVDVQGVELVPSVELLRGLTLSGNFTVIDETHVAVSPTIQPLRVPKHSAFGLLQYIGHGLWLPADKLTGSLAYLFIGDRSDIDPMTFSVRNNPGYHRFDLVLSYEAGQRWQRVSNEQAFVRVQNLFDRNYSEALGFKAPTVNFVAGLKVDFE
jgi:vitamin B12 transporter